MHSILNPIRRIPKKILLPCAIFLPILITAGGVLIIEESQETELKEAIRAYLSEKTEVADRQTHWDKLVEIGTSDLEFLIWGLEQTNSIFMFSHEDRSQLIQQIEAANPAGLISACQEILKGEMTVGKILAMDLLVERKALAAVERIQAILMNTEEARFVRNKAVATLGNFQATVAVNDLRTILARTEEPLELREACLAVLWNISPETVAVDSRTLLTEASTPIRLFKRAVDCMVEKRQVGLLIEGFQSEKNDGRKARLLKALLKTGDPQALAIVKGSLREGSNQAILEAALEGIAEVGTAGFDDEIVLGLRSTVKATRLRAALAANRFNGSENIQFELEKMSNGTAAEDLILIEAAK